VAANEPTVPCVPKRKARLETLRLYLAQWYPLWYDFLTVRDCINGSGHTVMPARLVERCFCGKSWHVHFHTSRSFRGLMELIHSPCLTAIAKPWVATCVRKNHNLCRDRGSNTTSRPTPGHKALAKRHADPYPWLSTWLQRDRFVLSKRCTHGFLLGAAILECRQARPDQGVHPHSHLRYPRPSSQLARPG
jgi:hypothetical protein